MYFKKLLLIVTILLPITLLGVKNECVGFWETKGNDSVVNIFKNQDKYFGEIVWLNNSYSKYGLPVKDAYNPNKKESKKPLLGKVILKNFVSKCNNTLKGGTVYDPHNGKTYKCIIEADGNLLKVKGYIGIPFFGSTEIWKRRIRIYQNKT
ncbi:MAG: DUF2147 domain-containing protein [bacterium]|nr:DUF2147 domain-containing protein [bacterium]